jgi:hypothetical protein
MCPVTTTGRKVVVLARRRLSAVLRVLLTQRQAPVRSSWTYSHRAFGRADSICSTSPKRRSNRGSAAIVLLGRAVDADPVVRRALLHQFPYSVAFLPLATDLRVLAIAHLHRRPGYWRGRVPL